MFVNSYKKSLEVILKKPFTLWGLSLMSGLISFLALIFFGLIPAIFIAVGYLLTCGMAKIYLDGLVENPVYSDQLFCGFNKNCFRIAGGMAWKDLWILIWALIPIAGPFIAIVKSYSYRFVPYILVTCPDVKATEALRISKQQTQGMKMEMFLADLCFGVAIGLACLVLTIFSSIPIIGILFALVYFVFVLLVAVLSPIFQGLYRAYFFAAKTATAAPETAMPYIQ